MRKSNLINANDRAASNQFLISCEGGAAFQSYDSYIAFQSTDGSIFLSEKWNCSATTLKHLKIFLGDHPTKKQYQKMIDQGIVTLVSEEELKEMIENKIISFNLIKYLLN